MSQEAQEFSFQVDGVPNVLVENARGSVVVQPGPVGQIAVKATQHGNGSHEQLRVGQNEDGSVFARSTEDGGERVFGNWLRKPSKVDFVVTVPEEANLVVKVVSSSADVNGISGQIKIKSVSGEISIRDAGGDFVLETVSGDLKAARLNGTAEVKTVSGQLVLAESNLPSLRSKAVSGDLSFETPIGAGPYSMKTVSGDMRFKISNDPKGKIIFSSISGRVQMDNHSANSSGVSFPAGPRKQVFNLSSEGPVVNAKSVSGDLKLFSQDGFQMDEAVEAQAEARSSSPAFLDILDQIAQGDLTVDEGLNALGK